MKPAHFTDRVTVTRGFTLLEIMVSVALLGILAASTFGVLIATNNSSQRIYRIANTQETARQALDILATDLRAAGLGIASGEVGVAPAALAEYRIPVVYSGPDMVVQQPYQRSTLITNSIFIVSADSSSLGLPYDGSGLQGGVTDAGVGTPMEILCVLSDGGAAGCETTSSAIYLGANIPLLVGDLRNAVVLTPTALRSSGNAGAEMLTYKEASVISLDPKAPYTVPAGALLSRLRVVHWYLRQDDPSAPPRLYRSKPVLASTTSFSCNAGGSLFQDETTGNTAVVGQDMGAGPVQSLQFRYVLDVNNQGPSGYQMANSIGPCDNADISNSVVPQAVSKLREVRVQVVSLSTQPDLTTSVSSTLKIGYTTPSFEGSLWTPDGGTLTDAGPNALTLSDPYPRRAFNVRVVPRALQVATQ